jgi:hypothetical protein
MDIILTVKNYLHLYLILVCLVVSLAQAQDLVSGTEVLLTDLNSETIVGHGLVEAGTLNLRLIDETGGFFLYFIFPDGQVATHQGQITPELIGVFGDTGDLIDFTQVLASRGGIKLNIIRAQDLNPEQPSDDGRLIQPGS